MKIGLSKIIWEELKSKAIQYGYTITSYNKESGRYKNIVICDAETNKCYDMDSNTFKSILKKITNRYYSKRWLSNDQNRRIHNDYCNTKNKLARSKGGSKFD